MYGFSLASHTKQAYTICITIKTYKYTINKLDSNISKNATVVVGGAFGDEGKGKIISYLCEKDKPDIVARGGIGPNAGHTVIAGGMRYGIRQLPSGFANKNTKLLIGAGVLVDRTVLFSEIEKLKEFNVNSRLGVDYRCTIIEEEHKKRDAGSSYLKEKIMTTGTGCGPANEDRVKRIAKRAEDINELKRYLTDVPRELNAAIDMGKNVLIEGTQGFNLSVYYGTYPFVTSKDTSASAILSDVGIGPTKVSDVIVVFKAYLSRVGGGHLDGELSDDVINKSEIWKKIHGLERGTVTGRQRRIAEFNFEFAKNSVMVNGATQVALTCIDLLFPECAGVTEYDMLSNAAKAYVKNIEEKLKTPITLISTGPELESTIDLRK
ncbi:MAG: adenylosuccinate synthetase [Candidatus Altiarchaeales archaeon HGW-Altiarchaeales-3]|nr:MAG: adenylosuccinate synthetase [Candidatus Altiarchaeales archaeon HGW-Altiarchaeales-3]